jgi:hypothetical protein
VILFADDGLLDVLGQQPRRVLALPLELLFDLLLGVDAHAFASGLDASSFSCPTARISRSAASSAWRCASTTSCTTGGFSVAAQAMMLGGEVVRPVLQLL